MAMGTYDVYVNGIKHTLQYDDEEAERLGLDATVSNEDAAALAELEAATESKAAADAAAAASAKAAEDAKNKQAAPANKAPRAEAKL